MLTDSQAISVVRLAYVTAIETRDGKGKPPLIGQASKSYSHTLKFFQAAESAEVACLDLMLAALECFPEKWCKKTFGRSYPPFHVVIGEKSRAKALQSLPPAVHRGNIKMTIDMYINQLSKMDRETAMELVLSGAFSSGNAQVQEELIRRIKEEF